ncbi:ThuA-like domain-containing protein [Macrophomina phaseolina]|uniref:ThuA-like domain-containing protein n=1 Tax=Macrophomina phaseolina TaxID=35725 RepID=A0ABQ8FSR3_9PEZI|nr:ThuA-like domain-containing protein [Macrophomina phaseolina]
MKSVSTLAAIAAVASQALSAPVSSKPNLLIFSKTAGYRHESIVNGVELLTTIADEHNWDISHSEDSVIFTNGSVSDYSTLVFLHTTGDFLVEEEFDGLYNYLVNGGTWLGIHSAADFWNKTPAWYHDLVGGQFEFHPCSPEWTCTEEQMVRYPPGGNIRPDTITVQDPHHPSTKNLPKVHNRTDEWYSYRRNVGTFDNYTVLATLAETYIDDITPSYLSMKPTHPISWYSYFEGKARSWYTGMGHTAATYSEPYFIEHVTGGLEWVVGEGC